MGISWGDFWQMTPEDMEACIKGRQKALELDFKLFNQKAWLQGAYVQQAVGSVMAKGVKYPKEPIKQGPDRPPTQEELREKIRRGMDRIKAAQEHKDIIGPAFTQGAGSGHEGVTV